MIVLLDTSSPLAKLTLVSESGHVEYEWQADRQLAKELLSWLNSCLEKNDAAWTDIKGIGVFRGPGSFTGLRIGLTVMNTLADSLQRPIVGATGGAWQQEVLERLRSAENDSIVLPFYDRDANITTQRK